MTKTGDGKEYKFFRGKKYEVVEATPETIKKYEAFRASPIGQACVKIEMAVRELVNVYWAEENGPAPYAIEDADLPERLAGAIADGLADHIDRDPSDAIAAAIRLAAEGVSEDAEIKPGA
jgi:hypothetical protein